MSKFLRILLLVFIGSSAVIAVGDSVLRGIKFAGISNSLFWVIVTVNICTFILAIGSFLFHLIRLRSETRRSRTEQVDTSLDDHLVAEETTRKIPAILRVLNILYGMWALLLCLVLLATIDSTHLEVETRIFMGTQAFGFAYSFVYIILGGVAHFVRKGH